MTYTVAQRRDYERGWRYSQSASATLDHGDRINASDAWFDGYTDYAAGREKWHRRDCPNHGTGPGTCGQG